MRAATLAALAALALSACVRRAPPLDGAPAPARLPRAELPPGHAKTVFRWSYDDGSIGVRGDGVGRVAPPDSARLDLFLGGGFGTVQAFLIGDTVLAPGGEGAREFLPPPPMLWAALGRLAVPAAADTVARVDGESLRADIGRDPIWRVTFAGDRLVSLERIERGAIVEWVRRAPNGDVRYVHEPSQRRLGISITRTEPAAPFDASIWP